jgi:SAM-dependent methyltransferase
VAFDPALLGRIFERRDPGIWFAPHRGVVSYPAYGHSLCLAVEERSFWFRHRNRCIISLAQRFRPNGVFLDVGGGNGFVAKGLTAAGVACALIEPGLEGALAAHARGVDPVICARLEDMDNAATNFAAAGMFDVLEHIEDEYAAVQQVRRLLAPNGRLFVTVPSYQFLSSVDDVTAGHFRRYTVSTLKRVLENSGFRIEYASYIFAPLLPIVFLLRTVPSALGLRREVDLSRDASELAPSGVAVRLMDRLLDAEFKRIEAGRTVPCGSSCVCVAARR